MKRKVLLGLEHRKRVHGFFQEGGGSSMLNIYMHTYILSQSWDLEVEHKLLQEVTRTHLGVADPPSCLQF